MKSTLAAIIGISVICISLQEDDERAPHFPRIASVVMADQQSLVKDPAVIWYDDFDNSQRQSQHPEKSGKLTDKIRFGNSDKSLEMNYPIQFRRQVN